MDRVIAHFSCGAASAVASKLAISDHGHEKVVVVNAFIVEEHEDNRRFLLDCERWLNHPIVVLRDDKYGASVREVWRRKRFLANGMWGAPCSKELKRKILDDFCLPSDLHILGYTAEESKRFERFLDSNNGKRASAPLIEHNLGKRDCLAIIERAGIELPAMYRMGYHNANCIGCCKGGEGYWNKIRRDFPERFEEVIQIQETIGPGAYIFRNRKTGERYGLKDLPPGKGRYQEEPDISCSAFCEMAEAEFELKDQLDQ